MNLPKLKKYDKIEVIWIDSNYSAGWHGSDSYKRQIEDVENKFIIHDIGFFMEYTKNYLILVGGFDEQDKPSHNYINAIPKSVIKKIKKLK